MTEHDPIAALFFFFFSGFAASTPGAVRARRGMSYRVGTRQLVRA